MVGRLLSFQLLILVRSLQVSYSAGHSKLAGKE